MEEPTQSIEVRKARQEDTDAIAAIYTESILARDSTMVTDPVSGAEMLEGLSGLDPRETLLVAQEGESVIGWGIVKLYSERPGYRLACETSVFLKRDHLGQGIGSLVQKELMASARNGGFHHVLVRIWAQNDSSIAMHRKFGFTIVGTQQEIGEMDGQWIDVTIMQCLL